MGDTIDAWEAREKFNDFGNDQEKGTHVSLSFGSNITSNLHCAYLSSMLPVIQRMNKQLLKDFNPDINGYTLAFLKAPPFKFLPDDDKTLAGFKRHIELLTPFAGIDFIPPQRQVQSAAVSGRTGGIPYATEVLPTEQASITYIDNQDLNIFTFHYMWVEYIRRLLEGTIEIPPDDLYLIYNDPAYGALDYAGSLFVAKYAPNMKTLKYLGKCTGVYPQSLPSKELIGQRSTNELTTLPFTYFSGFYEEAMDWHHPIVKEFDAFLEGFKFDAPLCEPKPNEPKNLTESQFHIDAIQNSGSNVFDPKTAQRRQEEQIRLGGSVDMAFG